MIERTLAELLACPDLPLDPGRWFRIDQERIDAFAECTNDRQWIHTDRVKARSGPFGDTVAHGYLTLSLIPHLFSEVLRIPDAAVLINYGLEQLRFPAAVRSGSEVRLRGKVLSGEERKSGVLLRLSLEIEVRGSPRPALVAETLFLAVPE